MAIYLDRKRDYYRDTVYHPSELDLLDSEIGRMAKQTRDPAVREMLTRQRAVCRQASEGGLRLFLVSD